MRSKLSLQCTVGKTTPQNTNITEKNEEINFTTKQLKTLERQMNSYYHGFAAFNQIGVGIDDFKQMRGKFVHIREWSNAERHDTSLAGKCSDVAVNSDVDVLTNHLRTLSVRCVFLQKRHNNETLRILRLMKYHNVKFSNMLYENQDRDYELKVTIKLLQARLCYLCAINGDYWSESVLTVVLTSAHDRSLLATIVARWLQIWGQVIHVLSNTCSKPIPAMFYQVILEYLMSLV